MDRRYFIQSAAVLMLAHPSAFARVEPVGKSSLKGGLPLGTSDASPFSIERLHSLLPMLCDVKKDRELKHQLERCCHDNPEAQTELLYNFYRANYDALTTAPAYMRKAEALGRAVLTLYNQDCEAGFTQQSYGRSSKVLRHNNGLLSFIRHAHLGRETAEDFTANRIMAHALHLSYDAKPIPNTPFKVDEVMEKVMADEREKHTRILVAFKTVMDMCQENHFPFFVAEKVFNSESGFDPKAKNFGETAVGLGQLVESTFIALLAKLPSMPYAKPILEQLKKVWPDILDVCHKAFDGSLKRDPHRYGETLAKREGIVEGAGLWMVLAYENAGNMQDAMQRKRKLTPGDIFLSNILNPVMAARISDAAYFEPTQTIDQLDVNPRFIHDNPSILGTVRQPLTALEVMARVNSHTPSMAVHIARELKTTEFAQNLLDQYDVLNTQMPDKNSTSMGLQRQGRPKIMATSCLL